MVKRKPLLPNSRARFSRRYLARRFLFAVCLLLLLAYAAPAIPVSDYHRHLQQAVTALDGLAQADETKNASAYDIRRTETLVSLRTLLPENETVEWNGTRFNVDNSWLHQELDKYSKTPNAERAELLKRITERLQAIAERIAELEQPVAAARGNKDEENRKLAEILRRPEYARKVKQQSALARLLEQFLKWLRNLIPKPKPISPGSAGILSKIAQVFVIGLAVAVLVFVARLFLPRLWQTRGTKRKSKAKARIVLGERLEPEQSALDLLAEAEALARRGELRAAIRKAYIALLIELGERKVISLAQHKTNRDYLRAMREIEPLYGNVKQLTDSFERHWYGLVRANETDWRAFRSAYEQALSR